VAYFFFKLIPPRSTFPADITPAEAQLMERHVAYWRGFMEATLYLFIVASTVIVLPFWCLMLLRRLSRTSAGKSLVEPLSHEGITDERARAK
jgi:hypothetical protein